MLYSVKELSHFKFIILKYNKNIEYSYELDVVPDFLYLTHLKKVYYLLLIFFMDEKTEV